MFILFLQLIVQIYKKSVFSYNLQGKGLSKLSKERHGIVVQHWVVRANVYIDM